MGKFQVKNHEYDFRERFAEKFNRKAKVYSSLFLGTGACGLLLYFAFAAPSAPSPDVNSTSQPQIEQSSESSEQIATQSDSPAQLSISKSDVLGDALPIVDTPKVKKKSSKKNAQLKSKRHLAGKKASKKSSSEDLVCIPTAQLKELKAKKVASARRR